MSPLDVHLRETLDREADDAPQPSDMFVGVERRARSIHRRRMTWAAGSTAAVVASVAVAGSLTLGGGQSTLRTPIAHDGSPSSSPSAIQSGVPTPAPATAHASAMTWPVAGTGTADWVHWSAVLTSVESQVPAGFTPVGEPHVVGVGDTDGGAVVVFVMPAGDHLVAGAVLSTAPGQALAVHDIATDGDVPYVGVVVRVQSSSGPVDDGVVVGAPSMDEISFRLPGQPAFVRAEGGSDRRWATVTLGRVEAGAPVAQVRVQGSAGDGHTRYEGPVEVGVTFPDV